jgi:hypothetical protein
MVPAAGDATALPAAVADDAMPALFGALFRKSGGIEIPFLKSRSGFCQIPRLRAGRMPVQFGIAKK